MKDWRTLSMGALGLRILIYTLMAIDMRARLDPRYQAVSDELDAMAAVYGR